MKLSSTDKLINRISRALLTACVVTATAACGLVYEDEGDCDVTYKLKFVYDYNMKWADAFSHEVKSVRLNVFDESGKLAWSTVESGPALASGTFTVTLPLAPGKYNAVAWCGADNNPGDEHFTIADGKKEVSAANELSCFMQRQHDNSGSAWSDTHLHPLYYGSISLDLPDYSSVGGEYIYVMPLMKDTNNIKIVLQDQSGDGVAVEDFDFRITDSNGSMAADNSLRPDETITYLPWASYSGTAGVEVKDDFYTKSFTEVSVAQVEFAVPRLMENHQREMILTITNKRTGKEVLKLPVIECLLLVRSLEAADISDQEYLDRQDQYSMIFFLSGGVWNAAAIYINSWRVVYNREVFK